MDKSTLDLIQSLMSPAKQGSSGSSQRNENQSGTRVNSDNEDSIFFNSLLDHVRKVPDDKKLAMRNEIQDTIMKFAYAKPAEAERCCGALDCPTMGNRHATANTQQTSGTLKTERMQKRIKLEVDYDTDDSDCEYVGHVVPMKKIVSRDSKRKPSKKKGQALLANTSPLLQVDPSPQLFQQLMLQQQQQYQMLQNLCTSGMRPTSAAAGAPETTPKAALDGNQRSPSPENPRDEAAKEL